MAPGGGLPGRPCPRPLRTSAIRSRGRRFPLGRRFARLRERSGAGGARSLRAETLSVPAEGPGPPPPSLREGHRSEDSRAAGPLAGGGRPRRRAEERVEAQRLGCPRGAGGDSLARPLSPSLSLSAGVLPAPGVGALVRHQGLLPGFRLFPRSGRAGILSGGQKKTPRKPKRKCSELCVSHK